MDMYIKPDICVIKMSDDLLQQLIIASPGKDDVPAEDVDAKQHDFFDVDSMLNKYVPNVFSDVYSEEEE